MPALSSRSRCPGWIASTLCAASVLLAGTAVSAQSGRGSSRSTQSTSTTPAQPTTAAADPSSVAAPVATQPPCLAPLREALDALGNTDAISLDERDRRARDEFFAGRDHFVRGEYRDAARQFEIAYALSLRPELLYNIGSVYDRLHVWPRARDAFQCFTQSLPEAAQHDEVRSRLQVIEQEIAHQAEVDRLRERAAEGPKIVVAPPRTARTLGFVFGGLAVIAGGVSLTTGIITNAHYDALLSGCAMRVGGCDQAVIDDVALRSGLVNGLLVVGGVLAVASVVSFVVDATTPRPAPEAPRRASVTHTLRVTSAGVAPLREQAGAVFTLGGVF